MAHLDHLPELLNAYRCDVRSPTHFSTAYDAVLSALTTSSSLTSRRYPIWPLIRKHLDEPFECCINDYKGEWAKELLDGARLSEMAQQPPLFLAVPYTERPHGHLDASIVKIEVKEVKPQGVPDIEWQLRNLARWDVNLRFAIRSALITDGASQAGLESICGVLDSVRSLFQLLRHFRPKRTTALKDYDVLIDDRIRPQSEEYCELCWRETIRSVKLKEINSLEKQLVRDICNSAGISKDLQVARFEQAWMSKVRQDIPRSLTLLSKSELEKIANAFKKYYAEKIFAGNLSCRYCEIHKPGSRKYHADLRYKTAFQNHLSALYGRGKSEFAINFLPPEAADTQELRKVAYDQVHSGLHPITSKKARGFGLREKIGIMSKEGLSQSEMARRLGISRQAVSKSKKSLEDLLNFHHAGSYINPVTGEAAVSASTLDFIKNAFEEGVTASEIARKAGLTKKTVEGIISAMERHR